MMPAKVLKALSIGAPAIAFLSIAVSAAVIVSPAFRERASAILNIDRGEYKVGDVLDLPTSAYAGTPFTVLVVFKTSCLACKNSIPFISQITHDLRDSAQCAIRLISMLPLDNETSLFTAQTGNPPSAVTVAPAGSLRRLRIVPSIMAVDRVGRIRFVHVGAIAESDRNALRQLRASVELK